jgi:hypothetical protein
MVLLDGMDQSTVGSLLGTDRREDYRDVEPEHPDCLVVVWPIEDARRETVDVSGKPESVGEVPLFLNNGMARPID